MTRSSKKKSRQGKTTANTNTNTSVDSNSSSKFVSQNKGTLANGQNDQHKSPLLQTPSSSPCNNGPQTPPYSESPLNLRSGQDESEEEGTGTGFPKIIKVVSLAPKRELDPIINDTSTNGGVGEDTRDGEGDDSILGLDYPDNTNFYSLAENAGHFLTGGAGLDSLSYSSDSNTFDGNHTEPALTSSSTIWDGIINLCEVSSCTKTATKKCSSCKSAFYCGEEHQKTDWKKHRNHCTPFKSEYISQGSDGVPISAMIAARNIPAGQVIFTEKPFLVFPLSSDEDFSHVMDLPCVQYNKHGQDATELCQASKPSCFGCLKFVEFIGPSRHHCSICGLPLCCEQCEFEVPHRAGECHVIANCSRVSDEEQPKRCYHSLYMDVEILRALQLGGYDSPHWDKFLQLKNHIRVEAYKQTHRFYNFSRNLKYLVPYSAKVSGYNDDLILDVHSIITALSFRPSLRSSFKMLFATQLHFLHDCIPNTVYFIEDEKTGDLQKMKLITKSASPIIKGEIITIDFTPSPYLPYPLRRQILSNLSIECHCIRCDTPSRCGDRSGDIKCPNCKDGYISAEVATQWEESIWSCHYCQEEFPFRYVNRIESQCKEELVRIPKDLAGVTQLLSFIERFGKKKLNVAHGLILTAWCFIESILRERLKTFREPNSYKKYDDETIRDFQLVARYCEVVGPHFDSIRPGLWLDRGILLFVKFYSCFALSSKDYQTKKIQRKEFIQKVLKSMKILQESLQILTVFEGFNSSKEVGQLTQEGTAALSTLKDFIGHIIMQDAAETNNNSMNSSTPTSTNL